jgi:hypothetical protein
MRQLVRPGAGDADDRLDVGAAAYSETDVSTDSQAIDDDEHDGTDSLMASPTQQGAAAADGTVVRRQPLMPPPCSSRRGRGAPSACMSTRWRRLQSEKSRRLQNGAGCAPAAAPPDPPVPSREVIFGQRAVEASGWDGGRPGGHRHHSPYPSVSSFSLHLLLGGAVLGMRRCGARFAAALGMRACCVRRSGCGQGGLRGMLTAMLTAKNREKCCPDCGAGCTRSV